MNRSNEHEKMTPRSIEVFDFNSSEDKLEKDKLLAEQPWLEKAVAELREPAVLSVAGQLRAVRRTALTQKLADTKTAKHRWVERLGLSGLFSPGMAFVAGLSAVAIATVLIVGPQKLGTQPKLQAQASSGNVLLEDLPIVAAQDDLQFYQDLELMQWLAQEESGLDAQG